MGRVRDVCYSVNVKGIRIEVVIYLSEKSFPGFSLLRNIDILGIGYYDAILRHLSQVYL
jgi:hypothetical protein